jgi:hypothetical protein
MQSTQRKNSSPDAPSLLSRALNGVATLVALGALAAVFVWNWDGFWQTDIGRLNALQERYFPAKYKEEQLKLSRIMDNGAWMAILERRLTKAESEAEKDRQQATDARAELASLREKDSTNCRYYKTSLKIIDNLAKKIPPEELRTSAACTNAECEQIIRARPEAGAACG